MNKNPEMARYYSNALRLLRILPVFLCACASAPTEIQPSSSSHPLGQNSIYNSELTILKQPEYARTVASLFTGRPEYTGFERHVFSFTARGDQTIGCITVTYSTSPDKVSAPHGFNASDAISPDSLRVQDQPESNKVVLLPHEVLLLGSQSRFTFSVEHIQPSDQATTVFAQLSTYSDAACLNQESNGVLWVP